MNARHGRWPAGFRRWVSGISPDTKDRYATDGLRPPVGLAVVDLWPFVGFDGTLDDLRDALGHHGLRIVAMAPEIYTRDFVKGSITNPDPAVRTQALRLLDEATRVAKHRGCDYVKLWFGQDGWGYPFQVNYHNIWKLAIDGRFAS
jgi:xylose isomerase